MIIAVDLGRKATKQTNSQMSEIEYFIYLVVSQIKYPLLHVLDYCVAIIDSMTHSVHKSR